MKIEFRSAEEMVVSGYVNAVERNSRILPQSMCREAKGPFVERIKAKTFEKVIARGKPVKLMFNHEKTIGSTEDGSLKLYEDNIGLFARAVVTDAEVISKAKELRGWSFAFGGAHSMWSGPVDGVYQREIDDFANFSEVSMLTVTPAYIGTSIEARGDEICETESRGIEDNAEITEPPKAKAVDYSTKKKEIEILKLKGEMIYES